MDKNKVRSYHSMGLRKLSSLRKIMLVSSEACDDVEKCLLASGCWIVKVNDEETAIYKTQREIFDAAVLVSTGNTTDCAETALNLRNVHGSMQIIVVVNPEGTHQSAFEIAAHTPSNTEVLTIGELEDSIESLKGSRRRTKKMGRKLWVKEV